ncbi:MAG TPA: hypothetical protein ENG03_09735 [Thioploca sp.]|nr:MAG: hypothetical protein B6247_30350 [Beggiatoa sp. 4572_84]RKZ53670.1 MAG: hypothetical protein DRR08_27165 [Gammaproteobacteria bacterium]HDN27357.1 hypothetical protein [Thioploca sp.]
MTDAEFAFWLLFMLSFVVLPIKPFFRYLFEVFTKNGQRDTSPCVEEEGDSERHYSQLYRPCDKKYPKIVKLSNNAKSIN